METAAGASWCRALEATVRTLSFILRALGSHWSVKISRMRDKEARVRRLSSKQEILMAWIKDNGEK